MPLTLPALIGIVAGVLLVAGVVAWFVSIYNRFVTLRNAGVATLNQIRVALRKRLDLITQLVEAVKSYARFEKEVLEKVTRLRASIVSGRPEDVVQAERESREILSRLLAVAEAYPELKTAEVVKQLMDAIREVEDEIARHRYTYNNIIQEYNTMIDAIPSKFVARLAGFTKLPYLEVGGPEIERRPKIEF